jgi:hypothetical protein
MLGEHGSSTLKCILAVVEEHKRATSFLLYSWVPSLKQRFERLISITAVKKFYHQIFRLVKDLEWAPNSTRPSCSLRTLNDLFYAH